MSAEEKRIVELEKELQKYRKIFNKTQEGLEKLLMDTRKFFWPEDEGKVQKLIEKIPLPVQRSVTGAMVHMYHILPLQLEGNTLTIATDQPKNTSVLEDLHRVTGFKINPLHCFTETLDGAIAHYFPENADD